MSTVTTSTPVATATMTQTHLADISAPSEELCLLELTQSVLSGLYCDTGSNRIFKNYQDSNGLKYTYYTFTFIPSIQFSMIFRVDENGLPPIERGNFNSFVSFKPLSCDKSLERSTYYKYKNAWIS